MAKPNLRFKEFTADWHNIKLGSFITERNQICDDSDIPLYSLTIEQGITPKTERYTRDFLVKDDSNAYKTVFPNDFAMNPMNLRLGAISYNQENKQVKLSKYYNVFYVDTSKVDRSFFCSYATCEKAIALYNLMATGSLVEKRRNHFKDFVEYEMPFPNINEQTKIASFLSTVDTKIAQLSQKLHLLGQYKQGMMQKLFSQQIRFKADDGSEFGEWEEKELNDVVEINPKAKKLPENFIYIDLESVEKGRLLLQKNIALQDAPSRAQRLLAKGDVLFQMVRPYQQNNYYFNLSGEYVASTGYAQIRTKLDSKFIYYALHEKIFLDEVMNRCTGTSYPAINSSDLSSIEILIPCLEEQTKIANFLSTIDQKMDVVSEQLEQAKQWKKGLLQQMFV